jgi:hypothetical protein
LKRLFFSRNGLESTANDDASFLFVSRYKLHRQKRASVLWGALGVQGGGYRRLSRAECPAASANSRSRSAEPSVSMT